MNLFTHRPRAARACLPGGTRIAVGWHVVSGSKPGVTPAPAATVGGLVGGRGPQGSLRPLQNMACSSASQLPRREDGYFAKESDR